MLDFYSGEEVMSLFKVRQSWLYTTAKRNRIPICRIAGKNYYSKKHVDEFFGMAIDTSNITDWLLIEEAEELFGMKPPHSGHTPTATRYRPKENTGAPITPNPIWTNSAGQTS